MSRQWRPEIQGGGEQQGGGQDAGDAAEEIRGGEAPGRARVASASAFEQPVAYVPVGNRQRQRRHGQNQPGRRRADAQVAHQTAAGPQPDQVCGQFTGQGDPKIKEKPAPGACLGL